MLALENTNLFSALHSFARVNVRSIESLALSRNVKIVPRAQIRAGGPFSLRSPEALMSNPGR